MCTVLGDTGMGRRSRNRRDSGRATEAFSSRPLASLARPIVLALPADLRQVEDRRRYHPLGNERGVATTQGSVSVRPGAAKSRFKKPYKASAWPSAGLRFKAPKNIVLCVRRKIRAEVLHALKLTGRGRGRGKKHFNKFSKIGC